jgi:hypothetical protein
MASSPEDALRGFQARAQEDSTLRTLLGTRPSGNARIEEGFPAIELSEDNTPLATYFQVSDTIIRPGISSVRLQLDIFVWSTQGGALRAQIDDRFISLFDEQHWVYGDSRLYALVMAGRVFPAGIDQPLRKTRDFRIEVSPTLGA